MSTGRPASGVRNTARFGEPSHLDRARRPMLRGAPLRVDCPWVAHRHGRRGEVSMIRKRDRFSQADHARVKGRIAQVVEQLTLNQRVVGSSPTAPTNKIK